MTREQKKQQFRRDVILVTVCVALMIATAFLANAIMPEI
jgi:preprotein translocase subunit SecE